MDWFDRKELQIEESFDKGEISEVEYREEMRDLQDAIEEAAADDAKARRFDDLNC